MKIAFIGAQATGKTTLINEFLKQWPMYKRPEKTYRDFLKEGITTINENGNKESQRLILDALVEEIESNTDEFVVFDRSVVDNVVYSLWLYGQEDKTKSGVDDDFITESRILMGNAVKKYDVLFYLPVRKELEITTDNELRSRSETYREEIDNIFKALVQTYEKNTGAFFPTEYCPAVITLDGPPDMRLGQLELYIKDDGRPYGEEDGSLIDPSKL